MPPHMQIDANDMQMTQRKPGFANVLCQAASDEVQPGLVCARSSHLGPRDLGANVQWHPLQEAFQDTPPHTHIHHCTPGTGSEPAPLGTEGLQAEKAGRRDEGCAHFQVLLGPGGG